MMLKAKNTLLKNCFHVMVIFCMTIVPSDTIIGIHRAGSTKLRGHDTDLNVEKTTENNDVSCRALFLPDTNVDIASTSESSEPFSRSTATICSIFSALLVGLSGILPLLILPNIEKEGNSLKDGDAAKHLNRLLSFAVGGLLGDVFLHLLPESWNYLEYIDADGNHTHSPAMMNGLWILMGLISFCFLEKLFPDGNSNEAMPSKKSSSDGKNVFPVLKEHSCNLNHNNNSSGCMNSEYQKQQNCSSHEKSGMCDGNVSISDRRLKINGYLNLFANCIDNFTHGLAIGGSYLVSPRVGLLTTMAILLHEIPHEIGDFAILLRAGFTRWKAARLQMLTAMGGLLGVMFALLAGSVKSAGDRVSWILPFTSGGFIYIALCTVVPDLLKETSPKESAIQMFLIIIAIMVMGLVSIIE